VDYDYVQLGGHDYLVPREATLYVREGQHYLKKNEMRFLNYRKYRPETTLSVTNGPVSAAGAPGPV